jgi:HEAT repeat protein
MPQSNRRERIIKLLGGDEPDYAAISSKLHEKDIPILNDLVAHQPTGIATRAIICLTWFPSDKSIPGIQSAAKSDNPVLRLTAARVLSHLSNTPGSFELISGLLDDNDAGVRKFTLKTIGNSKIIGLKEKVHQLCLNDPNEQIRKLAQQVYADLEAANASGR